MHYGPLGSACSFPFPHRLNQLLLLCCLHAERSSVIKKTIESMEIESTFIYSFILCLHILYLNFDLTVKSSSLLYLGEIYEPQMQFTNNYILWFEFKLVSLVIAECLIKYKICSAEYENIYNFGIKYCFYLICCFIATKLKILFWC